MRDVKIYVTTYCGYCHAAKALLHRKGVPFQEIDCTGDPESRRMLIEKTGRRTVPQIFIDGVPIGGYDDLRALDLAGELDPILAGAETPRAIST
jgi:glutaredoxin 3